jgi:hypothetical protein
MLKTSTILPSRADLKKLALKNAWRPVSEILAPSICQVGPHPTTPTCISHAFQRSPSARISLTGRLKTSTILPSRADLKKLALKNAWRPVSEILALGDLKSALDGSIVEVFNIGIILCLASRGRAKIPIHGYQKACEIHVGVVG